MFLKKIQKKLIKASASLKAGTYYIGDLSYVLEPSHWDKVFDLIINKNKEGILDVSGLGLIANFFTAHGDGHFTASTGDTLHVGSATLGCLPLSVVGVQAGLKKGIVHKFSKDFTVSNKDGVISFGDISIPTNLGFDREEILRLKQISGLKQAFANHVFLYELLLFEQPEHIAPLQVALHKK